MNTTYNMTKLLWRDEHVTQNCSERYDPYVVFDEPTFKILIVDDDQLNFHTLFQTFKKEYVIRAADSGKTAIEQALADKPDLILLDIVLPDMSGFEVLTTLKELKETRNIPIIFMTESINANDEVKGLFLGAVDTITKPLNIEILRARVKTHLRIVDQMRMIEKLGMIDPLTNMPNRRRFDQQIEIEWARTIREKTIISLLLIDVDHFKAFNDAYGHPMGDSLLQAIAKTLMTSTKRPADLTARIGGEEFAVLLPNSNLCGAVLFGEKIRSTIEALAIPSGVNPRIPVTVSIGAASMIPDPNSPLSGLITLCGKHLHFAKKSGRNRLCCNDNDIAHF